MSDAAENLGWMSVLVGLVVGLVGFLLRRGISGIDSRLETLSKHDTERNIAEAEYRVRVANMERQLDAVQRRVDDHSGFLSKHGFQKRGSEE